jgi:hypothetical protein
MPATKHLDHEGQKVDYPVAASTVIYKNSFVGLNASGYLKQYVAPSSATTQTGDRFVGIALEAIASQTSNGDKNCSVLIDGYFTYTLSSVAVTDAGMPVFISDDNTLSKVGTAGACIGHIVAKDSTNKALIKLCGFWAEGNTRWISKTSVAIDLVTAVDHLVLLVHESENPNGMVIAHCGLFLTTTIACDTTDPIVTVGHTTGTVTAIGTITCTTAGAAGDIVLMAADKEFFRAADDSALVKAPAGKAIIAKLTTVGVDSGTAAGAGNVVLQGFLL